MQSKKQAPKRFKPTVYLNYPQKSLFDQSLYIHINVTQYSKTELSNNTLKQQILKNSLKTSWPDTERAPKKDASLVLLLESQGERGQDKSIQNIPGKKI